MSLTSPIQRDKDIFYRGTAFAIEEIEHAMKVLANKVRELKQGNDSGSAVQQKLASEAISKTSGQVQMLADTLVRVTCRHLNRRPRI